MAIFIGKLNVPNYTFLSSEISSSAVPGISIVGAVCLATDTGAWYIVKSDLTLASYSLPVNINLAGDVELGAVEIKNSTDDTRAVVGSSGLYVDVRASADSVAPGTTAPSLMNMVGGKTNDATAQYRPIPEGAGGRSVIVEGVSGGTAVPISGTVDTELPTASALDGTIGKGLSAPVVGAALLVSDNTNLIQPLGDAANGLDVDVTRMPAITGSVTADTELPAASALNGTIAKSVSAPMVGAAIMYSDGTNLVEIDSTHALPVFGNMGRSATSVTPTAQGSTDTWTLVAGSILDTLNNLTASYTVQNTDLANSIDYKILAGNASDLADAVEVQASATVLAGAYGSYSTATAVWRYYGVYIQSTVLVTPGTAVVKGITKG